MGDGADDLREQEEMYSLEYDGHVFDFMKETTDELIRMCRNFRHPIINSIRKQHKVGIYISNMQRLVLARRLASEEMGMTHLDNLLSNPCFPY